MSSEFSTPEIFVADLIESKVGQVETHRFAAGRIVFNVGDPGDSLYLIRSGEVEVFYKDDTGNRIVLERLGPGKFFGEVSLLDGGPRTASVLVLHDLETLRVERDGFVRFVKEQPASAMRLLSALGRRLRTTTDRLRHTATRNVNTETEEHRTFFEYGADIVTNFSGSIPFLLFHLAVFISWFPINLGMIPAIKPFDPFPFGLLCMLVSLEAVILSMFVLISQRRENAKDRVRSDIEYDVNLKAEMEIAHLHEKVDQLNARLIARIDETHRILEIQSGLFKAVSKAPAEN
jgi:CRP/FNR family cyclic AMP-dependent transcriptional regulator